MANNGSGKNKPYTNEQRAADKSLLDVVGEVVDAIRGGMAGAARNSANPASEGSRARNRMQERGVISDRYREAEGKAYGGRTKMMCGGKAHGKKK